MNPCDMGIQIDDEGMERIPPDAIQPPQKKTMKGHIYFKKKHKTTETRRPVCSELPEETTESMCGLFLP